MSKVKFIQSIDEILADIAQKQILTMKSIGMIFYLKENEHDSLNRNIIANSVKEGLSSVSSAINELKFFNYLKIKRNVLEFKGKVDVVYYLGVFENKDEDNFNVISKHKRNFKFKNIMKKLSYNSLISLNTIGLLFTIISLNKKTIKFSCLKLVCNKRLVNLKKHLNILKNLNIIVITPDIELIT